MDGTVPSRRFDVAVIGGGAAGLSAARSAHGRGASVCLVEVARLGGDCTWTGCVPSKALLHQAHELAAARRAGYDGAVDAAAVFGTVRERIVRVAAEEDRPTLEAEGITVVPGRATFRDAHTLDVDGVAVHADTLVIATGSRPVVSDIPGLDRAAVVTNEDVFTLTRMPRRLAVLGGGAIGVEMAQAFARLGAQVTVLEAQARVAPSYEPEVAGVLAAALRRDGVRLHTGSAVTSVEPGPPARIHTADGGDPVEADLLLAALGRAPVTADLRLESAGVATDEHGHVVVDARARTTARHIYAVGDTVAESNHTHTAHDMGRVAAANALGRLPRRWSPATVPRVIYTEPEIAGIGMSESEAYDAFGTRARVAYFPLADTDRAKAAGVTDGFVKLIAGPHPLTRGLLGGRLVGATMVAPTAGDMIHEAALALAARTLMGRIATTVHAYPTWSLAVRECATQFFVEHKGRRARPARSR